MKSIQTFLEEFNCIPFEEKATILLQAWFRFFAIKHDQPENSNKLFHKLLEDLKVLAGYKESLKNPSNEIAPSSSNQEKEEPPQDSDIHQLIEECSTEVSKEQKQTFSHMKASNNVNDADESRIEVLSTLEDSELLKPEEVELTPLISSVG
nr:biopterin transport-related protein BT1 [Tanacetum cinerariifolium]